MCTPGSSLGWSQNLQGLQEYPIVMNKRITIGMVMGTARLFFLTFSLHSEVPLRSDLIPDWRDGWFFPFSK
jgi:hypothetical protein